VGERRGSYRVLVRNVEEGDRLKDVGVDGRIILKWIMKKSNGGMDWIDLVQSRDRWRGSCECGDEPSGSTKYGEFFEQLKTW
jgi:hypothetical protein